MGGCVGGESGARCAGECVWGGVAGGVLVNLFLCGPGVAMAHRDAPRFSGRVEAAALYWNFIGIIWILMFITFYLL